MGAKVGSSTNIGVEGPLTIVPWDKAYSADPEARDPDYPTRIIATSGGDHQISVDLWYRAIVPIPSVRFGIRTSGGGLVGSVTHYNPAINVAQHVTLSIQSTMAVGEYTEVEVAPMVNGPALNIVIQDIPWHPVGITPPTFEVKP